MVFLKSLHGNSAKTENTRSISIDVGEGKYEQWSAKLPFEENRNLDSYDYISFQWFGNNTGASILFEVFAPDSQNLMQYSFVDNWSGWKTVVLPIQISDGVYSIGGVTISVSRIGSPSFTQVNAVQIRNPKYPSPGFPNLRGEWQISELSVCRSNWLTIKAQIPGDFEGKTLSVSMYNGFSYDPLQVSFGTESETRTTISSQGFDLSTIFGSQIIARYKQDDNQSLSLSFKLPQINDADGKPLAIQLRFTVQGYDINSNVIETNNSSYTIPFNVKANTFAFNQSFQELAWYAGPMVNALQC